MKYVLYLICFLFLSEANAQTSKDYLLRTNFGFTFAHEDMLDAGVSNLGQEYYGILKSDLTYSLNGGRELISNFYYGLGLTYNRFKQEINPADDVPEIKGTYGFQSMSSYVNSLSVNETISPFVFVQYFTKMSDRFSVAIDVYSQFDFNSNKTNYYHFGPDIINQTYIRTGEYKTSKKRQYINVGIQPSVRFSLFDNLGLEFSVGLLNYKQKIKDSRFDLNKKSKMLEFGLMPENFLFGFYLKI